MKRDKANRKRNIPTNSAKKLYKSVRAINTRIAPIIKYPSLSVDKTASRFIYKEVSNKEYVAIDK